MKVLLIIILLVVIGSGFYWVINNSKKQNNLSSEGKLRVCPEEIKEPGVYVDFSNGEIPVPPAPKIRVIYNGESRDASEFDLEWIKDNCAGKTMKLIPM